MPFVAQRSKRSYPIPEKLGKIENRIRSGQDEAIHHRLLKIGARGISVPDLIIYHWIPASRLTKQYYRRWALSRGIGEGYQLRERGFSQPSLLGIPRFKFGDALRGARSILTATSPHQRLLGELAVRDCIGILYGRHIYGRMG